MKRATGASAAASPATPAPKTRNLTQQKTDFTAEGAPPPGKVALDVPVVNDEGQGESSLHPVAVPGTRKRRLASSG